MTTQQKIYTMEDWKRDRTFKAQPGQEVSQEVFDQMLNSMPPHFWASGYMQAGEPSSLIKVGDRYVDTYTTFNGLEFVGDVPSMEFYGISGALEMAKNCTTPEFIK